MANSTSKSKWAQVGPLKAIRVSATIKKSPCEKIIDLLLMGALEANAEKLVGKGQALKSRWSVSHSNKRPILGQPPTSRKCPRNAEHYKTS